MRRVALVTGSETGIGRATAVALARAGCDIGVVWHDSEDAGRQTVRRVEAEGARTALERLDLGGPEHDPAAVVDRLVAALGGVDVLVNVAGTNELAPLLEVGEDAVRRIVEVNLVGAFLVARAAARHMVAAGRGGRIVNVTSVCATAPMPDGAAYTASKAGLEGLTRALALELAPHGITANAVAPGGVGVPRTGFSEDPSPEELRRDDIPAGRLGRPAEVASAIVHLASPEAAYVSGATITVDGGLALTRARRDPPARQPSVSERVRRRLRR